MKYIAMLVFILVGIPAAAFAYDIPAPRPKAKPEVKSDDKAASETKKSSVPTKKLADPQRFIIQIDEKAKGAKLVIPNSIILALQTENGKSGAFTPTRQLDDQPIVTRIGTVVGGVLMTLAAMLGGLWFARSRKVLAAHVVATAVLILIAGIGTTSFVYANIGPPPEASSLTSKILKYSFVTGEVQVETTNDTDKIVLILPHEK